jgi:hypothetical protein
MSDLLRALATIVLAGLAIRFFPWHFERMRTVPATAGLAL